MSICVRQNYERKADMDIRADDRYKTELRNGLSQDDLQTLLVLYQPLCGSDSIIIYLTLASEAGSVHAQDSHRRLFALMDIQADAFSRALVKLEEYMLLRTYCKKGDSYNSYIYVLNKPMSASDFFQNRVLSSRYLNAVGQKQFTISESRLDKQEIITQGYEDITHNVDLSSEEKNLDQNVSYVKVKPRYQFSSRNEDQTINFDYERFIATTSVLVFPAELRTKENLALIGKLATVYGLSVDRMRILVKKCTSIETMQFDQDRLRYLAAHSNPDITKAKDPYSLSPVSFLQAKQNGAMVSTTDKNLLAHLSLDMNFSNEVINVMIEYILKISDNRLNPKFVDMVAGEWARDGISTKEQAIMETKKQLPGSSHKRVKITTPEWYDNKASQQNNSSKASKESIDEIQKLQKQMEEMTNGKN